LNECHSHKDGKILHRDLKLSNVFMDSENNVKLGDFGLSRVLTDSNNFAISNVGTPYYMSPEQIEELEYNEKSDIWSLGCFLYEISSLTPPFEASNHLSLANKIKLGKFDRIPSRYSEELFRIITWMLNVEPSKRPTLGDLINIPNVSLRLRERRLKDNIAKYKYLEEMHKLKENELQLKEKNLKEFENMLKERELKLEVKEKYLIEKERNLETKASKNNYQSKENIEKIFEKSESNPCKLHDLFKSESIIKRINTSGVLTTENSENSSNQKDYFFTPVMDKFTNKNPLQTPKEKNMKFIVKCDILENKEKSKSEKTLIDEIGDKSGDYESNNQLESHKNKSKITNKISTNTYQKANSQKYVKNKGELTEKMINKQKTLTNMMNDNLVKTQYK